MYYFVLQVFLTITLYSQLSSEKYSSLTSDSNPKSKSLGAAEIEHRFLTDVLAGSRFTKDMNYLFIDMGLEVPCKINKCEKYSTHELKHSLEKRGWRNNFRQDPNFYYFGIIRNINAGSSRNDVVLIKIADDVVLDILNLVRTYNRKSYLMILVNGIDTFHRLKTYLIKHQVYNVYVVRSHAEMYVIYEVCAFCKAGSTELKFHNTWIWGNGFLKEMRFEQSFKGKFFGGNIGIGMKLSPPGVLVTGQNSDGSPIYSGSDYWLLLELAKYLNFKPEIKQPKDGLNCLDSKHKPVGYCRLLLDDSVSLAGFPNTIAYNVFHWFDPTAVYYITGNVIVSARPAAATHWSSMLSSSDPTVLLLIFVSFVVYVIVYYFTSKFMPGAHKIRFTDTLLLFFACLCLEPRKSSGMKGCQRCIMLIWMLVCFFIISAVFGEITSIAATPGLESKPIETVEEMVKNKVSWVVPPGLHADSFLLLRKDVSNLEKKKKSLMFFEGLHHVLNNPTEYIYYFAKEIVAPVIRMHFWDGKGSSPFHFSPLIANDRRYLVTILVNKDAPFRETITEKLLQVEAAGLYMHKMMPDVLEVFGKISIAQGNKEEQTFTALTLDTVFFTFIVLAVGALISFLVFIYENFLCIIF